MKKSERSNNLPKVPNLRKVGRIAMTAVYHNPELDSSFFSGVLPKTVRQTKTRCLPIDIKPQLPVVNCNDGLG